MLSQSAHDSKQSPTSPWRRLLIRSRSLEGTSSGDEDETNTKSQWSRRRQRPSTKSNKHQETNNNNNNNTSGWAGWLLLTPPTRLVGNPLQRSSNAPTTKRHLLSSLRPSNLTLFLLHLDQVMPRVCNLLSTNSLKDCQEAARILDSSFCTQQQYEQYSPASSASNNSSSPRSPKFFGKLSPKRSNEDQHSAALHGEWETHVSPLLLLAGAQALYGQLECSSNLVELYKTIARDLCIVKERLCDPWLSLGEQETPETPSPKSAAHQAATSMARIFDGLQAYIQVKCLLVGMQTQLLRPKRQAECFLTKGQSLLETCRTILSTMPSNNDDYGPAMECMFASLRQEIKAWMALLQCAIYLQQCRFTETILSIRKFQQNMDTSSNTVLQQWFRSLLQRMLSIMAVYFDRIHAFATPLYGFDTFPTNEENDALVLDFLRKHESKGGPSMAVCIVMNAVATDNENFARGLVAERPNSSIRATEQSSTQQQEQLTPAERERKEWQAIYMRSTIHYNTPTASPLTRSPSHGSRSSIMRRSKHVQGSSSSSSFRKNASDDGDFSMSLANIMRPASQDSSAPAHSSQMSVMEYPPTTGPVSWPHSEWSQLVELVKQDLSPCMDDDGFTSVQAVTYRQPDPTPAPPPKEKKTFTPLGLPPPVPPPPKQRTDSSFHLVRLGEFTTMVVIVKCDDDGKWHLRRTRGHSDEEIRVFLNEMALKLKVSILFEKIDKTKLRLKTDERDDLARAWGKASNAQDFLGELKRSFHLRPQSPYMENLSRGRGMTTPGGSRRKKRAVSYGESALAFFVGPDLPLKRREA